jgi:hypothetical protein
VSPVRRPNIDERTACQADPAGFGLLQAVCDCIQRLAAARRIWIGEGARGDRRDFTRLIYPIATHKPQFPQLEPKKSMSSGATRWDYRFSEKTVLMQKR